MRSALRLYKRPGRSWGEHRAYCRGKIQTTLRVCNTDGREVVLARQRGPLMGHLAPRPPGAPA